MKKPKISGIFKLEKKLTTLRKIKCSQDVKRKLRKAARDWIAWEKQHIKDLHSNGFAAWHEGAIAILELFFNLKIKGKTAKMAVKTS